MDSILATKIIFYFITLSQVVNAGFLQAPFPYFVNPGDQITSAASPFIHGFGSPLVSPLGKETSEHIMIMLGVS